LACGGNTPVPGSEADKRREWMEMEGVRLRQYSNNQPTWNMTADWVEYERETKTAVMKNATINDVLTKPDGRKVAFSVFSKGMKILKEDAVSMTGGVRCEDAEHHSITTENADYDRKTKLLNVPGSAVFSGTGFQFTASSMKADLNRQVYEFNGGVKGRFESGKMNGNQVMNSVGTGAK